MKKAKAEKPTLKMLSAWAFFLTNGDKRILLELKPSRLKYGYIYEICQSMFWSMTGDYFEKVLSAKNKTNKPPTYTHYQTKQYAEWKVAVECSGPDSDEYKRADEDLRGIGEYCVCGYTTHIEARKIRNVAVYESENAPQRITWEEMHGGKVVSHSLSDARPSIATRLLELN